MHIPDGFVSGPLNAATFAISAGALGWAVAKAKKESEERTVPLLGVTAAFVFAAQMLNFPVAGRTSGHFLGAVLCGVLLGPFNACLVMGLVLIVQALFFADGGITAFGSNVFNMGVIGGIGGTYVFSLLRKILRQSRKGFLAAVVTTRVALA
jgi:cobalt/nickel transport system permease protein